MKAQDRSNPPPDSDTASRQPQERDPVAAFLESTVRAGATSQEVAEVVAKAFQDIAEVLEPIIGRRGMAALYGRSLHVGGSACARIAAPTEAVPMAMDTALLQAELAKQTAAEAAAAGTALLQVFHVLLTTLIGESLTERLLRSVWAHFLSGPPARDTQP